jgi:soluble lytic murein transglycosylase-like protein
MRLLAVTLAIGLTASAQAQVHLTVRGDGTKVISNIGAAKKLSDYAWLAKQRNRRSQYDRIIERHSARFGVDPTLVRAVIQVESDFNPRCISRRGARGLMQLMPETARRYGVRSIVDPDENIRGGIHYLADLLELFPRDLPRVLAAYNAGENAVARYAGIPPFEETTTYIKRALTVYYGRPWGDAVWFRGSQGGPKLAGGVSMLEPLATLPGMRILGNR